MSSKVCFKIREEIVENIAKKEFFRREQREILALKLTPTKGLHVLDWRCQNGGLLSLMEKYQKLPSVYFGVETSSLWYKGVEEALGSSKTRGMFTVIDPKTTSLEQVVEYIRPDTIISTTTWLKDEDSVITSAVRSITRMRKVSTTGFLIIPTARGLDSDRVFSESELVGIARGAHCNVVTNVEQCDTAIYW